MNSAITYAQRVTGSLAKTAADPRELRAKPRLTSFLLLALQVAALMGVFYVYHLEQRDFLVMSAIVFSAFLVHYWLPFRWKEPFWVAVSLWGAFKLLDIHIAAYLMAAGALFYAILRVPIPFRWRVSLLASSFTVLIVGRVTGRLPVPGAFYPIFGGIFMFRMLVYAYDLAHEKQPARLLPFLSYFFILPNYIFTFFPVIDFKTMRLTYYRRDIHEIAQQGIHWIMRGAIHLMLYRVVLYLNDPYLPDRVTTLPALLSTMVLTFLLYLNVSGKFHVVVGMLHLFGYDLPETHHDYLLSSSFLALWRRINIYWKDFMVKMVYFPVYFKIRKGGERQAKVLATAAVFLATWVGHSYQFFWLDGEYLLSWTDTIFWAVLGGLVIVTVLYTDAHKKKERPKWQAMAVHSGQVAGTFASLVFLWFFWSAPTIHSWLYLMTHWARVGQ